MSHCWKVIGLMSGTSLDGVDLVFVSISRTQDSYDFELLASETIPYPASWKKKLTAAFHASSDELTLLDTKYGNYLGGLICGFIDRHQLHSIDLIASHGHTIFHRPADGYTLQIGAGGSISRLTGLPVVYDFRAQDVALGGQGAPLVPMGDSLLFSKYDHCLNLGGFANISFERDGQRIAYDICPVNTVLNHYADQLGMPYDDQGKVAASGSCNPALLNALEALPYYRRSLPKSLGIEFVKQAVFPMMDAYNLPVESLLSTYTIHVAYRLAAAVEPSKSGQVLVTGGGAYNRFLIEQFRALTSLEVCIPEAPLVDYKEAIVFALLGVLRFENKPNCLRSVTGATYDHSSGKIFP